jgi:hypothetical protein
MASDGGSNPRFASAQAGGRASVLADGETSAAALGTGLGTEGTGVGALPHATAIAATNATNADLMPGVIGVMTPQTRRRFP